MIIHAFFDEINSLPGINFQLNFKHYSGYLDASNGNLFHYIFIESQGNSKIDPLILWLNGGPGCSSLGGLLNELGPYLINNDGKTLRQNLYSWNKYASIIFLESPAWVGFSYNIKRKNVTTNDNEVAIANYAALKDFFKKYPSFNLNFLFLTGESYAGKYIPTLASKIVLGQKETHINLKGIAIGNGILSDILYYNVMPEFAYSHGLVDEHLWNLFKVQCCNGCIDGCDINNMDDNKCLDLYEKLMNNTYNDLFNIYNMYGDCEKTIKTITPSKACILQYFKSLTKSKNELLNTKLKDRFAQNQPRFGFVQCSSFSSIENYLNLPEVQKALHIHSDRKFKWEECSDPVFDNYTQIYDDMTNFTKIILNANIRVMFYYGDVDFTCNLLIGQRFAEQLGIKLKNEKQPWILNGQIGGFKTEYENGLLFTTIRGAGHMSPETNPQQALYIFKQFLDNKPL